jgi:predicted transcriptional regulator
MEDDGLPVLPGFRAAGMSQTEVAARMGTSQSVVARLESGEIDARLSTLQRYAAAVGRELELGVRRPSNGQKGPA